MSKLTRVFGLLLLSACGSNSYLSSQAQENVPTDPISDDLAEQVVGHYAMLFTYASKQKLPIVGNVTSLGLLHKIAYIQREGDGLTITEKSCRLIFDGGKTFGLTFTDASIQSSPVVKGRFTVNQDSQDGSIRFAREPLTQILGANLADPLIDRLPESKDDPRVIDMDSDGAPGATADVRAFILTGSLNYVMRSTNQYEGTMVAPDVLQGLLKDRTDGIVLDVSNVFLRPAVGKFEFIPDPDASKSTVQLVKFDENLNCTTLNWNSLSPLRNVFSIP